MNNSSQSLTIISQPTSTASKARSWKSAESFAQIFEAEDGNKRVYEAVVAPTLPYVLRGKVCNFVAYGHSGSGMSHTIIGYDYDNSEEFGLCLSAARHLSKTIERMNAAESTKGDTVPN